MPFYSARKQMSTQCKRLISRWYISKDCIKDHKKQWEFSHWLSGQCLEHKTWSSTERCWKNEARHPLWWNWAGSSPTLQEEAESSNFMGTVERKQRHWQGNDSGMPLQERVQLFMINSAVTPEVSSEYRTFAVSHKIIYFSSENYCFCEKKMQ